MEINVDNFPLDIFEFDDDYSENVIVLQKGMWNGPRSPEIEARRLAARIAAITDEERKGHSERMKKNRPNMPHSTPVLSQQHKDAIAKGLMGNQNKTGKKGGNQYTKRKQLEIRN